MWNQERTGTDRVQIATDHAASKLMGIQHKNNIKLKQHYCMYCRCMMHPVMLPLKSTAKCARLRCSWCVYEKALHHRLILAVSESAHEFLIGIHCQCLAFSSCNKQIHQLKGHRDKAHFFTNSDHCNKPLQTYLVQKWRRWSSRNETNVFHLFRLDWKRMEKGCDWRMLQGTI